MNMFAVTTTNFELWKMCGRNLALTHAKFWPKDAPLVVYAEDFDVDVLCIQRNLPDWFNKWKKSHAGDPGAHGRDTRKNRNGRVYDFRYDCVRFAHKVAALTDAGLSVNSGIMVWVDADVLTHQPISEEWIYRLLRGNYMAWLDRGKLYPECGFVIFDCGHPKHHEFMNLYRNHYESNAVFRQRETHDSFVLQELVKNCVVSGWFNEPTSLSGHARNQHHPLPYSILGERFDHAKGPRKSAGRTSTQEIRHRSEPHWKQS